MGNVVIPYELMLEQFRFIRIGANNKRAIDKGWNTTANYPHDDDILKQHLSLGGNYGVVCGHGNLAILDLDTKEALEKIAPNLPLTFTVTTSKGKHFYYLYDCDEPKKIILSREENGEKVHHGELLAGKGFYAVGPSSTHPSGIVYDCNEVNVETICESELLRILDEFIPKNQPTAQLESQSPDELDLKIEDVLSLTGLTKRGSEYQGVHPVHGSETGYNFCTNPIKGVWHCFRHDCGGGAISLLAIQKGIISCGDSLVGDNFKKTIVEAEKITGKKYSYKPAMRLMNKDQNTLKDALSVFEPQLLDLAEKFITIQPLYYDDVGLWWAWSFERCCYIIVDDIDIMNLINSRNENTSRVRDMPIYNQKNILVALKMISRNHKPLAFPETCVQFRDKIFDYETKIIFDATPELFCTNPVPWKLGKTTDTPTIDKLFDAWVDRRYVPIMSEVPAYCVTNGHKIHRAVFASGTGRNGKSKYQKFIRKFVGLDNCTSSTLGALENDQFARFQLYKKQVCMMGETSYEDMKKSEMFKSLTGEDPISFRQLYHQSITDVSKAKLIVNSNGLPQPDDDSIGFWSRILPLEFPNQFAEGPCPVDAIPEVEFENFALKVTTILPNLMKKCVFTNEGTIEVRKERYMSMSNPIKEFLTGHYTKADGFRVKLSSMFDEYTKWLTDNHRRKVKRAKFKESLIDEGYEIDRQRPTPDEDAQQCVIGMRKYTKIELENVLFYDSEVKA
jgi:phage/plasmid-associated DNA primase